MQTVQYLLQRRCRESSRHSDEDVTDYSNTYNEGTPTTPNLVHGVATISIQGAPIRETNTHRICDCAECRVTLYQALHAF